MSLTAAEFNARIPHSVKRVFAHMRNALAVIGVLLLIVALSIFSKGNELTRDMDEPARRALGDIVVKLQSGDIASALLIRAPLAAGTDHADAEKAIRRRAKELNLEVVQAQSFSLAGASAEARRDVTVLGFCGKKTLEALLALRPELGALLPCTIVLVAEPDGQGWLVMLNLESLLYGGQTRDPALEILLLSTKDRMLDAMAAAAALETPAGAKN